jgi:PadR family transcriptional regulator PadR
MDLFRGTLDMLILRTLQSGPAHGFAIAQTIARRSDGALLVEEGSLYPALRRLEDRDLISFAWGTTTNQRRARFYALTPRGRRHLEAETSRWAELVAAIARVQETTP